MIKKYIRNYIIRSLITNSLFFLGDYPQNSASDTINNYRNFHLENINKKTSNTLECSIRKSCSFYSGKTKSQIDQIKPNLSFKYSI